MKPAANETFRALRDAVDKPIEEACGSLFAAGVSVSEMEIRHHIHEHRQVVRARGLDMFEVKAKWPLGDSAIVMVTGRWLAWPPPSGRRHGR